MSDPVSNPILRGLARAFGRCAAFASGLTLTLAAHAGVLSNDQVQSATGRSIDQWAASWWQWAFANPDVLGDTTGVFGPLGNVGGPVFFAEGSSDGTVALSYTVPGNQYVLLPVATYLWTFFDPCADAACATTIVNSFADAIQAPFASVDGVAVSDMASHLVRVDTTSPLVFQVDAGPIGPDGYGGILDAVESGYWLMLDPLSAGSHEITFGATVPLTDPSTGAILDGTDDLRTDLVAVSAVPEPSIVVLMSLCGAAGAAFARRRRGGERRCGVSA